MRIHYVRPMLTTDFMSVHMTFGLCGKEGVKKAKMALYCKSVFLDP